MERHPSLSVPLYSLSRNPATGKSAVAQQQLSLDQADRFRSFLPRRLVALLALQQLLKVPPTCSPQACEECGLPMLGRASRPVCRCALPRHFACYVKSALTLRCCPRCRWDIDREINSRLDSERGKHKRD